MSVTYAQYDLVQYMLDVQPAGRSAGLGRLADGAYVEVHVWPCGQAVVCSST